MFRCSFLHCSRFLRRPSAAASKTSLDLGEPTCTALTWFCAEGNIHATTKGYDLIGRLIVHDYTGHKKKA